jgi:hypothetical protein
MGPSCHGNATCVLPGTRAHHRRDCPQVEGGSKGEGRQSTMGQNQQAQNDVEQMAAPEGDRVLEGGFLRQLIPAMALLLPLHFCIAHPDVQPGILT